MSDSNFEALRAKLEALRVPSGQVRNLLWLAPPLAVGRTSDGDFEVYIRGPELRAASSLVRRHLQHGDWRPEEGGATFSASRIVLPSAPHFAAIATLIAIELIRADIAGPRGTQRAFDDVEPIVELAIRRGALPENVIVGLIGELTVLRRLILARTDAPTSLMRCLDFWQGWQERGGRDFRMGRHSIEVKATQAASSIHEFAGLHQLEPKLLPSGQMEQLHLLSVGLTASTTTGESLPSVVQSIVTVLSNLTGSSEVADDFVKRVALYGGQSGGGYTHASMADWSVYSTRYAHSFLPRLYRLDDPAMRVLTRDMLSQTFVQPDGLTFTMHIPEQVSVFNPAPSWERELERLTTS